jgi:hypothetical protein
MSSQQRKEPNLGVAEHESKQEDAEGTETCHFRFEISKGRNTDPALAASALWKP